MSDAEFLIGKTVGNYTVVEMLGCGGMGVVYKAHEASLDRMVALKVLSEELSGDETFVKRFELEARSAAQLNHPNSVMIHAVGKHEGLYYIAMEYVEGRTLTEYIRGRGLLDVPEALEITLQAAEALGEAHERGIVHRDIKPQNIMLDHSGRVKVMDFGLAKALRADSGLTTRGDALGTPSYMSPEQAQGRQVDGRSDIFSLGVTLYEMLAGAPPFTAETPLALMYRIINEPFPAVRQRNPEVPPAVEAVLEKMTAKDPEARYPTVASLCAELRTLLGVSERAGITPRGLAAGPASAEVHEEATAGADSPFPLPDQMLTTRQSSLAGSLLAAEEEVPELPVRSHEVSSTVLGEPPSPYSGVRTAARRRLPVWLFPAVAVGVAGLTVAVAWSWPMLMRAVAVEPIEYYVSVDGSDGNAGTELEPLATWTAARDAVRQLRSRLWRKERPVTVFLREGVYFVTETLVLSPEDSGSREAPVVYRAYPGETVRLIGGREVPNFEAIRDETVLRRLGPAARESVLQADLRALGLKDFGELRSRGLGPVQPAGLELFFGGEPMRLARWPNEGWARIAAAPEGAPSALEDGFRYEGDRPERWGDAEDPWVYGLWTWDWADSYQRIGRVDPAAKTIHLAPPPHAYGYTPGRPFYALNILEELDAPGEWYLDRTPGILYFWPPGTLAAGTPLVSTLDTFVRMDGVSHLRFEDLVFECCRGNAVIINEGEHDLVARCTIRNVGNYAVRVTEGAHHGISGCTLSSTGDGGISLSGGDRKTLEPGGHYATDNHISGVGRWCRRYRPAINLDGVGNLAAHNEIYDAPHTAIQVQGNDHIIEFNDIHHVCQESGEAGAVFVGSGIDWTERGVVIRHNFLHDLARPERGGCVIGLHLYYAASGAQVFGNVFHEAGIGVFINGGRDNLVDNNIFVRCTPAVQVTAFGLGLGRDSFSRGGDFGLYQKLDAVKHTQAPYSVRYPKLAAILEEAPAEPRGNQIRRNVVSGGEAFDLAAEAMAFGLVENNVVQDEVDLVDVEHRDFRLRQGSPVLDRIPDFVQLIVDEMGCRTPATQKE